MNRAAEHIARQREHMLRLSPGPIGCGVCCWLGRHWAGQSLCPEADQHRRQNVLAAVVPLRKRPLACEPLTFPELIATVVVELLRGLVLPWQVATAGVLRRVEEPRMSVNRNCPQVDQPELACGAYAPESDRDDNQIRV